MFVRHTDRRTVWSKHLFHKSRLCTLWTICGAKFCIGPIFNQRPNSFMHLVNGSHSSITPIPIITSSIAGTLKKCLPRTDRQIRYGISLTGLDNIDEAKSKLQVSIKNCERCFIFFKRLKDNICTREKFAYSFFFTKCHTHPIFVHSQAWMLKKGFATDRYIHLKIDKQIDG